MIDRDTKARLTKTILSLVKLPDNPKFTLSCTEPFSKICGSRVELGASRYDIGRIILKSDKPFQVPCQTTVREYAVIVCDDYIWDLPSKIYGEKAYRYFKRYNDKVSIDIRSDFTPTVRLIKALSENVCSDITM